MPKASESLQPSAAPQPGSHRIKPQSPTPPTPLRTKLIAIAACALLCVTFYVLAVAASWNKSGTADEPLHFVGAWVQTHQNDFRCNPEDPPLWKYWAVAGMPSSDLKIVENTPLWSHMLKNMEAQGTYVVLSLYGSRSDVDALFRSARARMTLLGVVLGVVICWWSWRWSGPVAAVVATAAMCLDPNFLAHAPLVKNDVAMTLGFVALMATVWLLGEKVTIWRWIALALLSGVALTVKFSGVLVFPMMGIAFLLRVAINRPWPILRWTAGGWVSRLGVGLALGLSSLLVGYVSIWACYGFRFGPTPDPNQLFDRKELLEGVSRNQAVVEHRNAPKMTDELMDQWVRDRKPSIADRLYQWTDDQHVLPQTWIRGFYYTYGRGLLRATFLCGNYSVTGWWYYFPAAMAFKTPVATLIALVFALICWLCWRPRGAADSQRDVWRLCAFLVCPVLYMSAAMLTNLNLGLRHVLPVYPFLFIFLGVIAAEAWRRQPRIAGVILGVFFLGLASETLSVYPDFIPFFNVAAGGARGGLGLLGDSNLDWGQDLPALADWQKQHPDRQMYLCYFGAADPRYYHLHYINMPGSSAQPNQFKPRPLPPVLAVSATDLQGIYLSSDLRAFYGQLIKRQPIAVLGGSIYVFDHVEDLFPTE